MLHATPFFDLPVFDITTLYPSYIPKKNPFTKFGLKSSLIYIIYDLHFQTTDMYLTGTERTFCLLFLFFSLVHLKSAFI